MQLKIVPNKHIFKHVVSNSLKALRYVEVLVKCGSNGVKQGDIFILIIGIDTP